MSTLLTNRGMPAALRARIEASITGRRGGTGGSTRLTSLLRLLVVGTVAGVALSVYWLRQETARQEQAARHRVLAELDRRAKVVTPREQRIVARTRPWVGELTQPYAGDSISKELSERAELRQRIQAPTVYLRGSLNELKAERGFESSIKETAKDAFVLCLHDPPDERTEQKVLRQVRAAYSGGERMQNATGMVYRLEPAQLVLPLLSREWRQQVLSAQTERELERMHTTLKRAPFDDAFAAARAKLLLLVVDEPGAKGLVELDGEQPHHVRIALVDLDNGRWLLRLRRAVDPSWLSIKARSEYARGADDCALALDVLSALPEAVASTG